MNKKALEILEYEKILKLLEAECTSDGARKMARELRPEASLPKVEEELRSTDEAVDLIVRKGVLPLSGIYQIEDFVGFAKKGGTLTMAQLLKIHYNLSISKACKDYIRSYDGKIDGIRELVSLLGDLPALYRRIEECIISEDEMSDRASKKLRDIRREKGKVNQEIKNRLAKMTSSPAYSTILQDKVERKELLKCYITDISRRK